MCCGPPIRPSRRAGGRRRAASTRIRFSAISCRPPRCASRSIRPATSTRPPIRLRARAPGARRHRALEPVDRRVVSRRQYCAWRWTPSATSSPPPIRRAAPAPGRPRTSTRRFRSTPCRARRRACAWPPDANGNLLVSSTPSASPSSGGRPSAVDRASRWTRLVVCSERVLRRRRRCRATSTSRAPGRGCPAWTLTLGPVARRWTESRARRRLLRRGDSGGEMITSASPAAGGGLGLDPAGERGGAGARFGRRVRALPSASRRRHGGVLSSSDPTGGPSAWTACRHRRDNSVTRSRVQRRSSAWPSTPTAMSCTRPARPRGVGVAVGVDRRAERADLDLVPVDDPVRDGHGNGKCSPPPTRRAVRSMENHRRRLRERVRRHLVPVGHAVRRR